MSNKKTLFAIVMLFDCEPVVPGRVEFEDALKLAEAIGWSTHDKNGRWALTQEGRRKANRVRDTVLRDCEALRKEDVLN